MKRAIIDYIEMAEVEEDLQDIVVLINSKREFSEDFDPEEHIPQERLDNIAKIAEEALSGKHPERFKTWDEVKHSTTNGFDQTNFGESGRSVVCNPALSAHSPFIPFR